MPYLLIPIFEIKDPYKSADISQLKFAYKNNNNLTLTQMMKKRINTIQIFQNAVPVTLRIDYLNRDKQKNDESPIIKLNQKFDAFPSKNQQISKLKIKQFNHPVVSQLRHLVINCIESANYFANCIKKQLPEVALKLFYQDSNKLTEYLNCLVVTKIQNSFDKPNLDVDKVGSCQLQELNSFKKQLQKLSDSKNNPHTTYHQQELKKQRINAKKKVNQLEKKYLKIQDLSEVRSQQSSSIFQKQFCLRTSQKLNEKLQNKMEANRLFTQSINHQISLSDLGASTEMKEMNFKEKTEFSKLQLHIRNIQKEKQSLKNKNSELRAQLQKLKNASVFMELGIFKSQQMILQFASYFENNHTNYLLDKQKINLLLSSLNHYLNFTKKQSSPLSIQNSIQRMKHEIQQMTMQVGKHRKHSMQLIKQKQMLIEEGLRKKRNQLLREDLEYQEMKRQINKLNQDLGQLMGEVSRKDQLIESMKMDNDSLVEDLNSMEKMNRRINENQKLLCEEMADLQEQIRGYQIQIDEQYDLNQQLNSEIDKKDKSIQSQLEELQSKQQQIIQLKQQYKKNLQEKNAIISQLQQSTKIVELQKKAIEELYQNLCKKNILLEEESRLLQENIQNTFYQNEEYKRTIQTLKKQVQSLEAQNKQFYQSMKMLDEWKQGYQQNINSIKQQCNNLKRQLKYAIEQCNSKSTKIQSLEKQNQEVMPADTEINATFRDMKSRRTTSLQKQMIEINCSPFRDEQISPIKTYIYQPSVRPPNILNDYPLNRLVFTSEEQIQDNQSSISFININTLQIIDQKVETVESKRDHKVQQLFRCYSDDERLNIMKDLENSINNREDYQYKNMVQYDKKSNRQGFQQGYYSDDDHLIQIYQNLIRKYKIKKPQKDINQNSDQHDEDHLTQISMKVNLDQQNENQICKLQEIVQLQNQNSYYNHEISYERPRNYISVKQSKKGTIQTRDSRKQQKRYIQQRQDDNRQQNFISNNQVASQLSCQSCNVNNC